MCKNKEANKLCSKCTVMSTFMFATRIEQFLISLNKKIQDSSIFLNQFVSDLVGNLNCWVSHAKAHMVDRFW